MEGVEGQLALVTGGASGIGLALARLLAAGGARLVLVDRQDEALERARDKLGAAVAHALSGDVASEEFWDSNAGALEGLSLAAVNAGVAGGGTIAELDFAEWRRVLSVNLDGAFLTLRAAIRAMAGRTGAIVITSSASGLKAEPGTAAYGASKAALFHLARIAAREGAPNIRVNAIAPAGVETPIWRGMDFFEEMVAAGGSERAAFDQLAQGMSPLGRFASAEEVAAQILFLLSPAAATITGATLTSDGGYTL